MFAEAEFAFQSRRSPVMGRRGMVAASQPLAVAAGLDILARGGNAADAAVAVAAALNVTEPGSTGLGGDCFALFYEAATQQVFALNGSGRAPHALTIERVQCEGLVSAQGELPPYHPYTVTVPGACAGWCDLVERFGCLPLETIFAPAIRLADEGFPVSPLTAYFWQSGVAHQLGTARGGRELTIDGRAPHAGEIFRNPGLALTLRKIASEGRSVFYQGIIAEAIAGVVQAAGGCLTQADLAAHTSTWERPISAPYHGLRIWECPPNGQGLAALLALNLVEEFGLAKISSLSTLRLHLQIEAMRLAFADAAWYVADPAFHPAPLDGLLSKEYAAERRKLIDPHRAASGVARGAPPAASDTVYFCTVDSQGNGCSFINSNYMGFGTGLVPGGWGFSLQNRGHNFSLDPQHPNGLAPGKRPYHTIIPGMITRQEGSLFACLGVMGGFMQPQGHLQVALGLIEDGVDPQTALDRPRFCIEGSSGGGRVALEEGIPVEVVAALAELGHPVQRVSGHTRALFGRGQIIYRDGQSGVLWGGSDPRSDGCAMALG